MFCPSGRRWGILRWGEHPGVDPFGLPQRTPLSEEYVESNNTQVRRSSVAAISGCPGSRPVGVGQRAQVRVGRYKFGPGENQRSSSRCSLFVRALLELEADGERGVTDALLTESKLLSGRNRFCYRIPILNQSFTKKRWRVLGCAQFFSRPPSQKVGAACLRPSLRERGGLHADVLQPHLSSQEASQGSAHA